jgi:CRP-like cAMP-binding protein
MDDRKHTGNTPQPGNGYRVTGFGEIAVLRRSRRSATVTATTRTNLLVRDASDLHVLMEQEPRIAECIHAVVRERVGLEEVSPRATLPPTNSAAARKSRESLAGADRRTGGN